MMKNDGGPAFPSEVKIEVSQGGALRDWKSYKGMSLRDYFAAKAMLGIITGSEQDETIDMTNVAIFSYAFADAMLKARKE